ncbi:MAG: acyl-[acyl-carrier-protein] thioesterase [Acidimicrobiia bacterium]
MTEFVPVPEHDRRYVSSRRVRLGDVRPDGSLRLDALARYAQDVATDDSEESGLTDETGYWVLRRVVGELSGRVSLGETVELTTFCGGSGPRWAERRTRLVGGGGATVELAAVWVHVDRATGAPLPVPAEFHEVYGAGTSRRVRARLEHPPPTDEASRRVWPLRATDFDVLGHVNNAVYWVAVEDEFAARPPAPVTRIEMEYRSGIDPGDDVELVHAGAGPVRLWFTVAGEVRASAAFWADATG